MDGTHLPSARRPGLNVRVAPGPCVLTMVLLLAVSPGVPEMSFHNKTEDATSILGGRWGKGVLKRTEGPRIYFLSLLHCDFPELADVLGCFLPDSVLGCISELRV